MITFISFIVVLGILILIHELGHFLMAKASGVGVEKFSLGFGPKIFGIRKGETEYRISLLPLGGYVKMVGEAHGEDVPADVRSKSFAEKSVFTRAAIVFAGPFMNLVLAIILLPVIFMIGVYVPAYLEKPARIGHMVPGGAAERAGVKAGDVVTEIDGEMIEDWEELLKVLVLNPDKPLRIKVERDGSVIEATLTPDSDSDTGVGYAGIMSPMEAVIGEVSKGSPAEEAGIKAGDRITAIDGKTITHWAELDGFIRENGTKRAFAVARGEETLTVEITPKFNPDAERHLIGVARKVDEVYRKYGFLESVERGLESSVEMTVRLFVVVKGLILGEYSLKTLGGPIMIAQVAGRAAEAGLSDLLSLIAFLSLQLGIINLFPIPVLDGGHILFFLIELVKGKPLSEKFMHAAHQVGIALIIMLMVLVTYNDIFRIFG